MLNLNQPKIHTFPDREFDRRSPRIDTMTPAGLQVALELAMRDEHWKLCARIKRRMEALRSAFSNAPA